MTGPTSDLHGHTETTSTRGPRRADITRRHANLAVAFMTVLIGILAGPIAIAHADPLFSKWVGHDRSLQLSPDGTGTLILGGGASDSQTWAVTWTQTPNHTQVLTLASLSDSVGAGSGAKVGDQYNASIDQGPGGQQVLFLRPVTDPDPSHSTRFCLAGEQFPPGQSPCGA